MPEYRAAADASRPPGAEPLSRALGLFDAFSDMRDEEQAAALAALRARDRAVHDALVRLLVADALEHAFDASPWHARLPDRRLDVRHRDDGSAIPPPWRDTRRG